MLAGARDGSSASHPRMRAHIFWALFGVSAVVLVVVSAVAALVIQHGSLTVSERALKQDCDVIAAVFDAADDPLSLARSLDVGETRLTLVGPDGTVLYDNTEPAEYMENHADRPEVASALATGEGSSVRESETLLGVSLYDARRLGDGSVLRLSVTRDGVLGALADVVPLSLALVALMALVSALVSRVLSRRLVAPLDAVDPMHPMRRESVSAAYAEVIPLLRRIDEQHTQIEEQMLRLTDNDRMRVEFTANVTHELKTPLTVISGYAELIEAGIAEPQDVPGFAGRIHAEARHLTALVNDILTLSRMDEAERAAEDYGVFEPIDLRKVCESVVDRLDDRVRDLGLAMRVEGAENVVVSGIPKLLDQIVYNLCDNALRYNRPSGSVIVHCGLNGDGAPFVSVADTGIGIAPENLEKVFNRFFRVDAGRSRETGGTGLGLAIVKHAVRCHDAKLGIESTPGEGTTITVVFHAAQTGVAAGWVGQGSSQQG